MDLYIDYIFNKSVEKHFKGFHDGFMRVCDGSVMKLFRPHELMAVVVGNEEYDWDVFEQVAEYKDGYSTADQTVINKYFVINGKKYISFFYFFK